MIRCILLATKQEHFDAVKNMISNGWIPDPSIGFVAINQGLVHYLIKLEEGDMIPELLKPEPPSKFEGIIDVCQVKPDGGDGAIADLVKEGWEVHNVLKDLVQLVRRESHGRPNGV